MLKKLKKILLFGILLLIIPVGVNAEEIKDGNKTYVLEELDLSCAGDRDYYGIDNYGNYIFADYDDDFNFKPIKVSKDNKCSNMTNQEILDVLNDYVHVNYSIDPDFKEIYKYTYYEEEFGYVKIKKEEYNENEKYYTYDSINDEFILVDSNDVNNIDTYYRESFFGHPKSTVVDTGMTLYVPREGQVFERVTINETNKEQIQENITKYFVEQEEKASSKLVTTISDEVSKVLSNPSFEKVDVIFSEDSSAYYFVVINTFDPEVVYSVYDQNGQLMFEDISDFSYIEFGIFSIGKQNKVELYNKNKELIYTDNNLTSLYEWDFKDNIATLKGWKGSSESYYTLSRKTSSPIASGSGDSNNIEEVPSTLDNVTTSILLGSISLIILGTSLFYLRKQKSLNKSK